jgi:hypothetical protein
MVKIFISYSRVDSDTMKKFAELLGYGCDVWYDQAPSGIIGGEDWWKRIIGEIEQREHFVYLLSPESIGSEWCVKEVDKAIELGKHIIPVSIRARTPLPENIKHLHVIEAYEEKQLADGTSRIYGSILRNSKSLEQSTLTDPHRQADLRIVQKLWSLISSNDFGELQIDISLHMKIPSGIYGGSIVTYLSLRQKPEYQIYNATLQSAFEELDKYFAEFNKWFWEVYKTDDTFGIIPVNKDSLGLEVKNILSSSEEKTFEILRKLSMRIRAELPEFNFPIE